MKKVLGIVAVIALAVNAQATVTLNIDAEALKNIGGTRIVENAGLVLIVADTAANGFAAVINPGSTLALNGFLNGGDDQIIGKFRVESGGNGDGDFEVAFVGTLGVGSWAAGNAFALYWFSDATTASASATAGMHYNDNALTKDANWVTPANGSTISRSWFTADGSDLGTDSNHAAALGNTSLIVVPEPSSMMLVGIGLLGAIGMIRRRS